jgi:hypothetical protein
VSGIGRAGYSLSRGTQYAGRVLLRGRLIAPAALLLAVTVLLIVAAPSPAPVTPRKCGEITVGSKTYLVKADQVRCRTAKRWARRYLKSGWSPNGYTCRAGSSGSQLKFRCWKGQRTYFAIKR